MPMAAFDTMSVAKRLEREFDVPARQAEGFASVLHENFVGNVATKEDLARTEERLGGEIAAGRKDVEHLEERLAGEIAAGRRELGGEIATANREDPGRGECVGENVSGKIPWRKRRIANVPDGLNGGDARIVSKLSRPGRSMPGCMASLSIAATIHRLAVKVRWHSSERSLE